MAHASVASLIRTIESLLISNSPMQSLIPKQELCALREKVSSLELFVKNFEKNNVSGEMTDFEVEVKEVASAVEYTIQLRLTETVVGENKSIIGIIGSIFFKGLSNIWTRRKFRKSLQQLAKDIDHVWKETTKIQDKDKQVSKESLVHDFASSTNDILNVNNNMVGRDDLKERLLEDLTITYPDEHKVIPIVRMGGIGKTTLAKEVYNHGLVLCHFDVRAWATVSQQPKIKEIFLSLLQSTNKMDDTVKTKREKDLKDMLQKSLKRNRYLIVFDDIWSCEVWDGGRRCFPTEDFNAGSRTLLTTRNNEVACYADTENLSMQMGFMNKNASWDLFKSAAFSSEALPFEFESVGKQITHECHGLPLTIVVVAGLLKSKREIDDWEKDSDIPVKRLVRSWMAEGFLKLENDLEGEAEKCLQELVDRCLVLVCKKSLDGTKIRSCKAKNAAFKRMTGDKINDYCCYSHYRALLTPVHRQLRDHDNNDLLKRTRSIFSFHISFLSPLLKSELIHFKFLKVLELRHEIYNFPLEILSLIWLRYLSLLCLENFCIPPEIYRLWNLQTFIVQGCGRSILIYFPEEIQGLMQLRHLKLPQFYLPNPPRVSADKGSHMGFSTLLQEEGYETDLSIRDSGLLNNLVHLQQLETLGIKLCFNLLPASAKPFPATLKKLKLEATALSWSY
ncbi:hypothetical protein CQW23_07027 [Capsicum baccatum]|uniref:Uncharacterized protein n=1 Tax=Capsicum baccatum TaxID=33114 RepID=A0A2G2X4Y6_CAPBA|nr:hypothetical protein CQW23_07027 [Capsicum baccatum]